MRQPPPISEFLHPHGCVFQQVPADGMHAGGVEPPKITGEMSDDEIADALKRY
jgi:hypothetical protein